MQQRISAKIAKFHPSLTLSLKRQANVRREQGLPVYDFGLGETKGKLAPHIAAAAAAAYQNGRTMYEDPAGIMELRVAALEWLDLADDYGPENVIITAGAKQSLFNIFLGICNPSDCVLLDSAPWVSYQPLAIAAYAFPVMVLPEEDERYLKITAKDLERNLGMRPESRLFLLNNPCNPTGQLYTAEEVEALLAVCVEHEVYFVLDRLYWKLLLDGQDYPAPRIDEQSKPWIIQVDGISKNFRRTGGLRIGWTVAPADLAQAMASVQSHYTSGPATPAQVAALAAISHPYSFELRDTLRLKRDLIRDETRDLPHVEVWPTPATFYSFWDVRGCFGMKTPEGKSLECSNDVAEYLITTAGIVTASGQAFMQDGFLRISFAVPDEELTAGIRAAREAFGALSSS
jgi:aspartate aminotransferase